MIEDIQRLLGGAPFQPFTIVTSSGKHYRVASRDHAEFSPDSKRVPIWFDDSSHITVPPLQYHRAGKGVAFGNTDRVKARLNSKHAPC